MVFYHSTRWFKYDLDYLCVNKSQFVPVIFEPPCISYAEIICNDGVLIEQNVLNIRE
jgi:hypothetical protein